MSYYKYLERYSAGFLRKYQTETYSHLSRSTRFTEIVHMNATSTLSIDEDLTLNLSVPFNITNFLGFAAVVYWYFYHIDMFTANTIKNRLRSYHNYKMWTRLEMAIHRANIKPGLEEKKKLEDQWCITHNVTKDQLEELTTRRKNGEEVNDIIASWGMVYDVTSDRLLKL